MRLVLLLLLMIIKRAFRHGCNDGAIKRDHISHENVKDVPRFESFDSKRHWSLSQSTQINHERDDLLQEHKATQQIVRRSLFGSTNY